MQHIPVPVVERLAVFADDKSLVLFASCSQWLWQCVGIQQRVWRQRYIQHYTFKDDDEVQWLSWYVRTLRVSGALAATSNTAIDVTQLNDHDINWFRAFCHRRATSANWLRDKPYPIYDIVEDTSDSDQVIVLQRISNNSRILGECGVIEQCQPIGKPKHQQFWRLRKVCCDGFDPTVNVEQFLVSDKFAVAVCDQRNSTAKDAEQTSIILIWHVHKLSYVRPQIIFELFIQNIEIRDRWMLVTYIDKSEKMAGGPSLIIATRVFDLATGQMCMGAIKNVRGKTFLHRVTNETADIVYTTIADVPGFHIINWSIWQFSILLIEDTPRCLMEGKCTISYTMEVYSPLERLDEDRFLIRHGIRQFFNASASEQNPEVLNLAVISTRSDGLNQDINNQNFMWSHYIDIYDATPILSLDRIITSSKQGWTVYDLTNGAVLSHIDRSRLELVFSHYLTPGVGINLIGKTCWIPGFVICQGKDEYSIMLMDLLHPERSRPLKIMDTTTTLNTTPKQCTRNALFISQNDKYKIIDLSC